MGTVIPLCPSTPKQCPLFRLLYKSDNAGGGEISEGTIMFYQACGFEGIGPEELNKKMQSGDDFFLLDVRTPVENAVQAIEGSYLIPVQELAGRVHELPKDRGIVIYCRIGNRSAYACAYLAKLGYKVKNLEGGIALWNMAGNTSVARAM